MYEIVLKTVGADGGNSGQGFTKAGEDDGLEDGFVAFYFAGGGAVVRGVEEEEQKERCEGDCELRGCTVSTAVLRGVEWVTYVVKINND